MIQHDTLTDVFLPLLGQRRHVPLKAIATIGEIIALDARLRDYGGGLTRGATLDEIDNALEAYEQIIRRAEAGTNAFLEEDDELAFIALVSGVKSSLADLVRP